MFLPKMNAWNLKMNPFWKRKSIEQKPSVVGVPAVNFRGHVDLWDVFGEDRDVSAQKPRGFSFLGEVFWHRLFALM